MKQLKTLVCNQAIESRYVQVVNQVNTASIRRETAANGDPLIIIPSFTLPDDIVMNGGLYPKQEIENSYRSLEGTPAPIGHPRDTDGNLVTARSEIGIDNFHVGVWNSNVQRKDNRIYVEKKVNERVAMQSELGKKLISKVNALLAGEDDQPIHTSVGLFVRVNNIQGNVNGNEYEWSASEMEFDHDAILLDEEGAAKPSDGVGMMVNKQKQFKVHQANIAKAEDMTPEKVIEAVKKDKTGIWNQLKDFFHNSDSGHGGRDPQAKGNEMKLEDLIKMLKANGVTVADNATEAEVTEAFTVCMAAKKASEVKPEVITPTLQEGPDLAEIVANALKPVTDKLESLELQINAKDEAEKTALVEQLKGEFEESELKAMSVNTLQVLAGRNKSAYQVNAGFVPQCNNKLLDMKMPNLEVK